MSMRLRVPGFRLVDMYVDNECGGPFLRSTSTTRKLVKISACDSAPLHLFQYAHAFAAANQLRRALAIANTILVDATIGRATYQELLAAAGQADTALRLISCLEDTSSPPSA
jgi:hypothetical protein